MSAHEDQFTIRMDEMPGPLVGRRADIEYIDDVGSENMFDASVQQIISKMLDERYKEPPREVHTTVSSMSVRDEFARSAFGTAYGIAREETVDDSAKILGIPVDTYHGDTHFAPLVAAWAYKFADAMVAESKKHPKGTP